MAYYNQEPYSGNQSLQVGYEPHFQVGQSSTMNEQATSYQAYAPQSGINPQQLLLSNSNHYAAHMYPIATVTMDQQIGSAHFQQNYFAQPYDGTVPHVIPAHPGDLDTFTHKHSSVVPAESGEGSASYDTSFYAHPQAQRKVVRLSEKRLRQHVMESQAAVQMGNDFGNPLYPGAAAVSSSQYSRSSAELAYHAQTAAVVPQIHYVPTQVNLEQQSYGWAVANGRQRELEQRGSQSQAYYPMNGSDLPAQDRRGSALGLSEPLQRKPALSSKEWRMRFESHPDYPAGL